MENASIDRKEYVNRVLQLLESCKGTKAKLLDSIGLPRTCLTEWKKGKQKPSLDTIIKISKYFGISSDWILFGDDTDGLLRRPFEDTLWVRKYINAESSSSLSPILKGNGSVPNSEIISLSDEERALISKIRSMDNSGQGKVYGYVDAISVPENSPNGSIRIF